MKLADDYKNFAQFFPQIIKNWRPVNGQTETVSQARLEHFKDYFEVSTPATEAADKIVSKWRQSNTDGFALIQAELGIFEHQSHFCDYLADLCFVHAGFDTEFFYQDNYRFNLVQSHWERLMDEVGTQNTQYNKFKLKLELDVWLQLINVLRDKGEPEEFLELLPKELEALINDVERGLEYFDAPFCRSQEEHEKVRVRLNRSTQEYFEALQRYGLKTIADIRSLENGS